MTWWVYIVRTDKGTLYTGITNNLEKRLAVHRKSKGAKYLRLFKSFELVYKDDVLTRSEALKREAAIKKLTKSQKEAMVASVCKLTDS